MLESNLFGIIDSLCEVIEKINHDRNTMTIVLTTLDAIFTDDKRATRYFKEIVEHSDNDKSLLSNLKKIISISDHE